MPDRKGIVRIIVFVLLIYSLLRFAHARQAVAEMERTAEALQQELLELEQEHAALERRLSLKDSPAEMEALARRELGMVKPGEIVFVFDETDDLNLEETERESVWPWK